jgi:hypothetical protein
VIAKTAFVSAKNKQERAEKVKRLMRMIPTHENGHYYTYQDWGHRPLWELKPEWLRIPDATRFSGLGRSLLYELIKEGKVKSVCLRKRNKARGIRLISADSLSSLIESEASGRGHDEGTK